MRSGRGRADPRLHSRTSGNLGGPTLTDLMTSCEAGSYVALFAVTLGCQIGLPIPAFPAMIAAGMLVRSGAISSVGAASLIVAGMALADVIWYEAGRRYGPASLGFFRRF